MDLSLTTTHQSKTDPSVTFVLNRLGPKQRAQLELKYAKERAELRELEDAREELRDKAQSLVKSQGFAEDGRPMVDVDTTLITGELRAAVRNLGAAVQQADSYQRATIAPEYIEVGLVSVANDGVSVPLEAFALVASDDLYSEIYQQILSGGYLSAVSAKNLQPSTTTSAVDGGKIPTTSAEHAKSVESMQAATATSTFPSA